MKPISAQLAVVTVALTAAIKDHRQLCPERSAIKPETMAFLVYHEMLHHHLGTAEGHGPTFRAHDQQFPNWSLAQGELDALEERFRVTTREAPATARLSSTRRAGY